MVKNGKRKNLGVWKVNDSNSGPSTKMTKLLPWSESDIEILKEPISKKNFALDSRLTKTEFFDKFSASFKSNKPMKIQNVELLNDPFQVAVVKKFIADENMIPKLVHEMENIEWTRKQMDLYEFYQSTDLVNVQTPYISNFYNFITNDLKSWMEELTGMKFQKVSVSCSMYNCSNFLLSHDDLLSDRLIAYVFYLSPWTDAKEWNESMGGALEIFNSDTDGQPKYPEFRKFFPSNNQFAFFKVGKKSHHQVGEILTKDYPRLTIHGWFHGYEDNIHYDANALKIKRPNMPIFQSPNGHKFEDIKIINKSYLKDSIKAEIQKQIEENSEAGLGEFLTDEYLSNIQKELNDSNLKWKQKGPANQQNYETLDITSLSKNSYLKELTQIVGSKQFFKLLHEYTELDLYGTNCKNPKFTVEFQRWKGGCYALINDPSTYSYDSLDLILNIGCNEGVGTITYLVPDKQDNDSIISSSDYENDDDTVLLTIYPQNNFLNLVYRSSGTAKFTKYCYKSAVMDKEFYRICSTISYIVVIFMIGIPMWWKTTEIHRAALPSDEITMLDATPITFNINIGVYLNDVERLKIVVEELEIFFRNNDVFNANIIQIQGSQSPEIASVRTPANLEKLLSKFYVTKPGDLLVAEWRNLEDDVLVTNDRTLFVSSKASSEKIYQVIRSWIVRDYKIRSILGQVKTFDGKQLRHNFPPPSPEYEIMISVLNPKPDLQTIHWNVKKATVDYLQPFLKEFSELSDFTIKSQWKYQIQLKYDTKQIRDSSKVGRHFALDKDSLPHIITSIERKLGTDVANKPCIHLVVYAPPCNVAPVYIYKNSKRVANFSFDSFVSAKWGGIVIANPSDSVCSTILAEDDSRTPKEIYLHSNEVMDFVLYELRKIFELEVEVPIKSAALVSLEQIPPRLWERDMYLRNGAIHLIASATSTLKSLIKLLDDIKNIVIGDHVGQEILDAYQNVVKAKEYLTTNDIEKAVKHARIAYIAAEKAFNDPSLLELLYFPEEQKYAIYIPLYLPVMIPVLFSFNSIKKYFKKKNEETSVEEHANDETKEPLKKDE